MCEGISYLSSPGALSCARLYCHYNAGRSFWLCHCRTSSQAKKHVSTPAHTDDISSCVGGEGTGGSQMDFLTAYQAHSCTPTCCTRTVTVLLKCVKIPTTATRCAQTQRALWHMTRDVHFLFPRGAICEKCILSTQLTSHSKCERKHTQAETGDWCDSCCERRCFPAASHGHKQNSSFIYCR